MVTTHDTLLTVPETALALKVSKSMVYRLIKPQCLKVVKVGNLIRIRPVDLETYICHLVEESVG